MAIRLATGCVAFMMSTAIVAAQTLTYPSSLAVDAAGNIYLADSEAQAVFKLDRPGTIVTLARANARYPTPLYRLSGIAISAAGEIAASDAGSSNVYRLVGGKPVPVADSMKGPFGQPQALIYHANGDLIVPDLTKDSVFRVAGNRVSVLASVAPMAVCIDKAGNIVVVSAGRQRLTRIDQSGKTTTIVEGAPFEFPVAVAAHPDGGYVIADVYAQAVFKVTAAGRVTVLAKGGQLGTPTGIAIESNGNLLVVDPGAKALFRLTPNGQLTAVRRWK